MGKKTRVVFVTAPRSRSTYGFWNFVLDCFMTIITCGFWLIWVFVREIRRG